MAKNVKNASKAQAEGLKYVPMRKAARAMTFVAGALSSGIVVFSVAVAALRLKPKYVCGDLTPPITSAVSC